MDERSLKDNKIVRVWDLGNEVEASLARAHLQEESLEFSVVENTVPGFGHIQLSDEPWGWVQCPKAAETYIRDILSEVFSAQGATVVEDPEIGSESLEPDPHNEVEGGGLAPIARLFLWILLIGLGSYALIQLLSL